MRSVTAALQRMSPFKSSSPSQGGASASDGSQHDGAIAAAPGKPRLPRVHVCAVSGTPLGDPSEQAQLSPALSSDGEREAATEDMATVLADHGVPPEGAAAVAAAAGEVAQQKAEAEAAGLVGHAHGRSREGLPAAQRSGTVDLEVQLPAARAAADASAVHPQSSIFRRCFPCVLRRLPGHHRHTEKRMERSVERSESVSCGYRGPDAAQLFWFGRPRIMIRIIQVGSCMWASCGGSSACDCEAEAQRLPASAMPRPLPAHTALPCLLSCPLPPQAVYLENSLSIAAILFSLWQQVRGAGWGRWLPAARALAAGCGSCTRAQPSSACGLPPVT